MSTVRVSKWLQEKYPNLNQRQREEALDSEWVLYSSGKKAKKGDKVPINEQLNCDKLEQHLALLIKGDALAGVKIIKEENGFVVVDKPSGIASHPISLFDTKTLTHWTRAHYPQIREEFPEAQPTLTPHRLDTGTSGIVIIAKQMEFFVQWRERFKKKEVKKSYLAWCWGAPSAAEFVNEYSIAHAVGDSRKMVAVKGSARYKTPVLEAYSSIKVLTRVKERGIFLAQIDCSTGVTHQVRVHLAILGFPLIGDKLYDPDWNQRTLHRPFHALRAISLTWGEWSCSVPNEEFKGEFLN